jgi:tetratricopeptide (TPR) repeat protein
VAGPGFARDALVYGAGVLDVAPTVLAWFGLPFGDDMEGRVLMETFAEPPAVARIPSWETSSQPPFECPGKPRGGSSPGEALERETVWNLAQSCLDAARYLEAIPLLQKLFQAFPERAEVAHALFQCQMNLGLLAEAEQTLELLLEALPPGVLPLLSRAELSVARGEIQPARALVEQLRQLNPTQPHALRRLGLLLLRLREWRSLADLARRAIEIDDTDPVAWLGLAEAELRLGKPAEAEQAATRAIRLKYFLPHAHFVRARALVAQSKWTEARAAMQTMLHLQPANRSAAAYARKITLKPRPD